MFGQTTHNAVKEYGALINKPKLDDGSNTRNADWWVIKEPSLNCSCGLVYVHLKVVPPGDCSILVWPREDDPNMADNLSEFSEVLRYERSMGKCISYYKVYPS